MFVVRHDTVNYCPSVHITSCQVGCKPMAFCHYVSKLQQGFGSIIVSFNELNPLECDVLSKTTGWVDLCPYSIFLGHQRTANQLG